MGGELGLEPGGVIRGAKGPGQGLKGDPVKLAEQLGVLRGVDAPQEER